MVSAMALIEGFYWAVCLDGRWVGQWVHRLAVLMAVMLAYL